MTQVKRLKNKLKENAPVGLDAKEQRNFISEKAQAIERYLTCEPQEESKAFEEVERIDKKYGIKHNSTFPEHLRHYLD